MELMSYLARVPAVVWASIGGASLAILGSLSGTRISNRGYADRLRTQLDHDAKQKDLDRTLSLRREIYMRAAEEIVKVHGYLGSLSQLDFSKPESLSGLNGFQAEAAKLQLVAEPNTAILINDLSMAYAELQLRLFADLLPLQVAAQDLALVDESLKREHAEHDRVLSEISRVTESGQPNAAMSGALNSALQASQQRTDNYLSERQVLHHRVQALRFSFFGSLVAEMKKFGPLHISVLLALRRDLGFGSDHLEDLTHQMERGWKRAITLLDSVVSSLKDLERGTSG